MTKKLTRSVVGLGAVVALVATLGACSSPGGDGGEGGVTDLTFTWWGDAKRADITNEALAIFNKEHPDIKVTGTFSDWNSYWQKRATEAAGGGLPDVIQMDLSYIREYGQRGVLLDLSPYLDKGIDMSGFNPTLLPSGQIGDATYGVPTSTTDPAFFYNPAVLEATGVELPQADQSWADFKKFIEDVTAAGGGSYYGADDYTGSFKLFTMYLLQNGKKAFTDDGELGFTKDDMAAWWHSVDELRAEKAFFPPERATEVQPNSPFQSGEVAAGFAWSNFLASYTESTKQEQLDVLPIPFDDPSDSGMYTNAAMLMSAAKTTKHPEAVATFIDFWVNSPEVSKLFGTTRGMPATESAAAGTEFNAIDTQVQQYQESIADLITPAGAPPAIGFGSLETEFINLNSAINYGTVSVEDAVDQWFAKAGATQQ
ncbi:ABC transporter substrate-binding protein [Compostimonas suwonensis]|uniref:Multiple sugar transport system substrate-binding protein n=1 Tax=Compostimonas suwonensis TaxID=1048394 RepID=A0A2M9BVW7_9MICO|nr:sugar ABC transporter substrate-binding protein [Compostimonas suwonensis]PJJ62082.1 multiple sugar transport system substrate-binding protein [Compostimonas suwonensis]